MSKFLVPVNGQEEYPYHLYKKEIDEQIKLAQANISHYADRLKKIASYDLAEADTEDICLAIALVQQGLERAVTGLGEMSGARQKMLKPIPKVEFVKRTLFRMFGVC